MCLDRRSGETHSRYSFPQTSGVATGATAQFQDPSFGRGHEAVIEGNICGSVWTQVVVFGGLHPSIGWHRCLSERLTARHEPRGLPRWLMPWLGVSFRRT
jgi:hypothetical protein